MAEFEPGTRVWMLRDHSGFQKHDSFVIRSFIPAGKSGLGIAAYLATDEDGNRVEIPASYCYPGRWGIKSPPKTKTIKKLRKPVKKLRKLVR